MAREPTLFVSNPYPQLFYRALNAALVGHALVLAAMGLYASGSVFQAEPPVAATPVSLVLTAPATQAVSSPAPAAKGLAPRPSAEPPPKPTKPVDSPKPVKSPEKLEPVQAVDTNQTREAPESAALPTQPSGPARQDSPTSPTPVRPVDPAAAASSGQSNGLPGAGIQQVSSNCPKPPYPRFSRLYGEEGVSELDLLIGEDGRVRESRIARSSGFFRLDQAALQAFSECEFEPERVNGVARQAWARLRYVWRLD